MSQPLLVTAAIIVRNKEVLLMRRGKEPHKGEWSILGGVGAFERSSNPIEAVKGEVKADLDCEFEPTFFTYEYQNQKGDVPKVKLYFYGPISGDIKISPDYVLEYKWFSFREAIGMKLAFGDEKILRLYIDKFSSL